MTRHSHAALHQNLSHPHGFRPLTIEGQLPAGLRGTLYRAGPGQFERFGVRVEHVFEADGAVTAVRFDGRGGAEGAAAIVKSPGWHEEEAAGQRLYGTGADPLRRRLNSLRQRGKTTGNTSAWVHNGRVFALMEGSWPVEIDGDSLEVRGALDFDGVVQRTFSAHPQRVASLATSFNFGVRYQRDSALDLYALPDGADKPRYLGAVELPWPSMVHDFVATETHLLFMVCPVRLVIWRALLGIGGIEELFTWEPERGSLLIAVPLDARDPNAEAVRVPCEPFWVWHFVNGFTRGTNGSRELVVDLCRYPDFSSLGAIDDGERASPPNYQRAIVDLGRREARFELRWAGSSEFPGVHPAVAGAEHRFAYLECIPPDVANDRHNRIGRLDVERGEVELWEPPAEVSVGEPVPVAYGEGEDAVHLLTLCHDDHRARSFLAVLDGRDLAAGPVAKLWFDHSIPTTFHGAFASA